MKPDGSCQPIVCAPNQYVEDKQCKNIPFMCQTFDYTLKRCTNCTQGYFLNAINHLCQRVPCPDRFVPAPYSHHCIAVSPLCGEYHPESGACITCRDNGYIVIDGKCRQAKNPLAGCKAMQELGFGECPDALKHCDNYNLKTMTCIDCEDGYYKNYQHRCVPNPVCS